ncbi:hypothetical protein O181_101200 [Austropuccinia psidii MF-1]|uniref:Uncharacterized protein n=1 Tax=Austropuccinia psidii MF-1 TaxID=1389203 RepID=A0A9Q3PHI8_9BASI|nr:hypothetical protein [Austropuccinia psidii MF-1]
MKEEPQLKEWPTFTGEGEYDHMSFIKTIDMLQEDYAIPDELITTRSHELFEKSAKRGYYGIRKTNGKNTWSWWKNEIITEWANDAWRYKTENVFENSFFDHDKDKTLTWLLKQVEILNALFPEMLQKTMHVKILRRARECPKKKVYRTMLHRRVYQCIGRYTEKNKNWQKMETIGH